MNDMGAGIFCVVLKPDSDRCTFVLACSEGTTVSDFGSGKAK